MTSDAREGLDHIDNDDNEAGVSGPRWAGDYQSVG